MSKPPHNERGVQKQTQQQPQQTRQISLQQWSGPLPSPADLERFNHIIPDGAARILAMAEKEQHHRVQYETTGLDATIKEARRGQFLGAFISVAAVAGAVYTASIGAPWFVSAALVGIPVLGLVTAIVRPRSK